LALFDYSWFTKSLDYLERKITKIYTKSVSNHQLFRLLDMACRVGLNVSAAALLLLGEIILPDSRKVFLF
jgi:hypothetical protein